MLENISDNFFRHPVSVLDLFAIACPIIFRRTAVMRTIPAIKRKPRRAIRLKYKRRMGQDEMGKDKLWLRSGFRIVDQALQFFFRPQNALAVAVEDWLGQLLTPQRIEEQRDFEIVQAIAHLDKLIRLDHFGDWKT